MNMKNSKEMMEKRKQMEFDEADGNFEYFGVIQSDYGADHVYVYSAKQVLEEFRERNINPDLLPDKNDFTVVDIFWPMGGSNVSATRIESLTSMNDVKNFLCQPALGPNQEDPELISLAEYYLEIDLDEGCADDFLNIFGLNEKELEENAMKDILNQISDICNTLQITESDFYKDEYREMRVSEIPETNKSRLIN